MKKLYLYTSFHANLNFSSIPEDQYSSVLDKCYWPALDLLKNYNMKLGLEFPASTLKIIDEMDNGFTSTLKKYWSKSRCEIIGSGYSQNIFPLIPSKANLNNLIQGNKVYEEILGKIPVTAFVNEQTYSNGLVGIYKKAGYENLIADWDNANKYNNFPKNYKYNPKILIGADKSKINLIWNSSISFQQFQRYIQDNLSFEDYITYLNSHHSNENNRSFLLYAYDLEIFNYQPGHGDIISSKNSQNEFNRINRLFEYLDEASHIEVITPNEVVNKFKPQNEVSLGTSEYPIQSKKQFKYNVTRWAVCGRENSRINSQCYHIFNILNNIEFLNGIVPKKVDKNKIEDLRLELTNLWSSDFRTHTTDTKYMNFRNKLGATSGYCKNLFNELCKQIHVDDDFVLINPNNFIWENPYEYKLYFEAGKYRTGITVLLNNQKIETQLEEMEYYRDRSIKSVKLVIEPYIKAHSIVQGKIIAIDDIIKHPNYAGFENGYIETDEVKLKLSPNKGASIKELSFPKISNEFMIGELGHGYYEDIEFSNDWFSGHSIIHDHSNKKYTDLEKTEFIIPEGYNFPIRIPVFCKIKMPIGFLLKKYYVYLNRPRVDLVYHYSLNNIHPSSFRLGIITFNPDCFNMNDLRYSTVNGGSTSETFYLKGKKVFQDKSVSSGVSTHHCLGATEGWMDISDNNKGFSTITKKSQLFSVPLIHYEEIDDSFLLRSYNSISEMDDTTETFFKGHNEISFTFIGHKNDLDNVRNESLCINNSLIMITANNIKNSV
jgi:hypothetical protein